MATGCICPILRRAKLFGVIGLEKSFNQTVDIFKIDVMKQIVYGKALVPNKEDLQEDIVSKQDIENAAHNFLINIQKAYQELFSNGVQKTKASEIGLMHRVFKGIGGFGYIVESYIDDEGSWVVGTKITDSAVWKMVLDKKITGYSIGGKGIRIPVE